MRNSKFTHLAEIVPYLVLIFSIIGVGISFASNNWSTIIIFILILALQLIMIRSAKINLDKESLSTQKNDNYKPLINKITELENYLSRYEEYFGNLEKSINELKISAVSNISNKDDLINHKPLEIMESIAELIGNIEKRITHFQNKEDFEIIRPGLKKGNRIFLRAKVKV